MKAIIRSYYCSESEDLSTYEVEEPSVFGFQLTIAIGPDTDEGTDYFEVLVASASYLAQRNSALTPAFLRHIILASDYNVPEALALVEKYVSSLEGNTWYELATKLNRMLRWEYEDYKLV